MAPPKVNRRSARQVANQSSNPLRGKTIALSLLALLAISGVAYVLSRGGEAENPGVLVKREAPYSRVNKCKVFIENSGSMDGYVEAVDSHFKSDLNALVSNLSMVTAPGGDDQLVDTVELNYINTKIIPIREGISQFAERLSVQSFRRAGGDRKSTSIPSLLRHIQAETGEGEVSILYSDMILDLATGQSPEHISADVETSLREQLAVRPDWSVVVWRMLSNFKGKYYHKQGVAPQALESERPYYIIFMGDRKQLRSLLGEGQLPANLPLWRRQKHSVSLESTYLTPDYRIDPNALLGSIELDKQDASGRTIADISSATSPDGGRGVVFELSFVNPGLLQSDEMLLHAGNYSVSPASYRVAMVRKSPKGEIKLRLQSDGVVRGKIQVSLQQVVPHWFTEVHADSNVNILSPEEEGRTYGIKHILEGMYRPYETKAKHLLELPISIK